MARGRWHRRRSRPGPLVPVGLRDRGEGDAGTLDAPRRLVAVGPYRWVRDPINIASLLIVIPGAWLFLSPPLLVCARGRRRSPSTLFVIGYEEPTLRRRFGAKYVEYRRSVLRCSRGGRAEADSFRLSESAGDLGPDTRSSPDSPGVEPEH